MATSKLQLYNGALRLLGERTLATIDENVESRYVLDDIWDDEALDTVLDMGLWNFAGRTVMLEPSTTITPDFGFRYAYPKPDDFIRTMKLCEDEYTENPLSGEEYDDEAKHIFCDIEPVYFQYVSNDVQWGSDLSLWPPSFTKYVQAWMAKASSRQS